MKVLILGSGGREHALALKTLESNNVDSVFVMPGNVGMELTGKINVISGNLDSHAEVFNIIKKNDINFVIVGPEQPLAAGIVDFLQEKNITVFGPTQKAAMLESSKIFSKKFMKEYNIPTADFRY